MGMIDGFEKLLAAGKDGPLLRFSLGNEYLKAGRPTEAIVHLRAAVEADGAYSAAWKLLGKALTAAGDPVSAGEAYTCGIAAAAAKGDKQAVKEMTVFRKRLDNSD